MSALGVLEEMIADMGGDTPGTTGHRLADARAAVADAFDVLRMSAEALETAAKYVGGDLAVVLNDRAMFARAALARVGGAS